MGSGCDLTVERGHTDACLVPLGFELTPDVSSACVETENSSFHAVADGLKPLTELCLAPAISQTLNATTDFTNRDGAHIEVRLVLAKPLNHLLIRFGFDRFAIDVGINQIAHSEGGSESSPSRTGISNGAGQASRRFTRP